VRRLRLAGLIRHALRNLLPGLHQRFVEQLGHASAKRFFGPGQYIDAVGNKLGDKVRRRLRR
jgi:hypothetical protein